MVPEREATRTKSVPSKRSEPYTPFRNDIARAFRPNEVVVLLAISSYAWGEKTTCSPAIKTVMKNTKLSQPTVERAIRHLCTYLWRYCTDCGESYITYSDERLPHPKPSDKRSEYERVLELKKTISLKTVLCPSDKHEEENRPAMEVRGPAIRRTARTGTSNTYTIFREEPT